jgi:hypothetical protein
MARKMKKSSSVRVLCKRCEDVPGPRSAGFGDALTFGDAVASARRINNRVRRDRKEFKEARKKTRLAALLPRWCPDESAGE